LRRQIVTGRLQAGDPLPPEDELMVQAGAARTTVREALRILESEGLLIVRRGAGGGARIRKPAVPTVARYIGLLLQSQGTTLQEMYAARTMLEAPAAGLLAQTEQKDDILKALREALAGETAVADKPAELSRAHGRFHQLIVELTGSQTFSVLTAVASRIIQAHSDRFMASHGTEAPTRAHNRQAHRAHERLVELIAAGASADAEDLWRRHLEAGEAQLMTDPDARTVLDLMG
jgi:DNA-binding FadR family transcriptional regulator